jgi:hypothetical protein
MYLMAKQYENCVSAKGIAKYFKVNTAVDVYKVEGQPDQELGYLAPVYFDEATTKAMVADVNARLEAAKTELINEKTGKPKKWLETPFVPYATDDDGEIYFKFKTSHLKKDADGNDIRKYVPVFDTKNKPLGNDVAIGNGSIVKIAYSPNAYHVNANVNGLKFFLNAIQVIDLVEFGGGSNGGSFGFGEESGYVAPVDPADDIDDPFDEE